MRVFGTGSIWLGVASLLTFFLANVLVLSWADYSYVQPASSVGYGVVALLGYFMLGEPVSPLRWLGIAIICLGVLVVGQTNPRSLSAARQAWSAASLPEESSFCSSWWPVLAGNCAFPAP